MPAHFRPFKAVADALLAAGALAILPDGAGAAIPDFARTGSWVEVRTAHFQIITSAGVGVGSDVGTKLERFARALGQLNSGLPSHSPQPTIVYVFRDQSELDHYRPAESENLVAFFTRGQGHNTLVLNGSPEHRKRSEVVFHEFVHCYLHAHFPAVPLWLNEGLAEYYSTCRLSRNAAEFGTPEKSRLEWITGRAPISLGMMFAMSTDAPAYQRSNELRSVFYAQSSVLTHWLQSQSGGRAERFDRFLARLHDGMGPTQAFREQFPLAEWDAIVGGLDGYLREIDFQPTRKVALPPLPGDEPLGSRSLGEAEALLRLGELMLSLGKQRHAAAVEHFEAALALDPGSARAHALLGLLSDWAERPLEAESHYCHALAATPPDAFTFVTSARGTLYRLREAEGTASSDTLAAIAALARSRFARVLELDPRNLEAMAGPGQIAGWLGEPADTTVVSGLQRAVAALPGRYDLAAALAIIYARQGPIAEAESLLARRVAPGMPRAGLLLTRHAVWDAALQRARELAGQGRTAEADSLLRRVSANAPLATTREEAIRMLAGAGR